MDITRIVVNSSLQFTVYSLQFTVNNYESTFSFLTYLSFLSLSTVNYPLSTKKRLFLKSTKNGKL